MDIQHNVSITFGAYTAGGRRQCGGWTHSLAIVTPHASFTVTVDEGGNTYLITAEDDQSLLVTPQGESAVVVETK